MLSERALINASKTLSLGIRCVHGLLQIRFFHVFSIWRQWYGNVWHIMDDIYIHITS